MKMLSSKPSSIVLTVFLLFLFQCSSSGPNNDNNLIHESCMKASKADPRNINYDFCVAYLEAAAKGEITSLENLTDLPLNLAETNASDVVAVIYGIISGKKHELSPNLLFCLRGCSEFYYHATEVLGDAIIDFRNKHFVKATRLVNYALDASTTCEDVFKEKGKKSIFTNYNKAHFQECKISLAFIELCRHRLT